MRSNLQGRKSRLTLFSLLGILFLLLGVSDSYGAGLTVPTNPIEMSNASLAFLCCGFNFIYGISVLVIPVVVVGFILASLYKAETRRQQEMKNPLVVLYTGVLAGGGIVLALRVILDTLEAFGIPAKDILKLFYLGFYTGKNPPNLSYILNMINSHLPHCCFNVPNSGSILETMFYIVAITVILGHIAILFSTLGSIVGFTWRGATEAYRILKYEEDWREAFYRFVTYTVLGFGVGYFMVYILQVLEINTGAIAQLWIKQLLFP